MQDVFYEENDQGDSPRGFARWVSLAAKWTAAVISLGLIVGIIVWSYRLGVRDAREIPVIEALGDPARIRPEDPGGAQMAHQGLEVNEILAGNEAATPQTATLAPATVTLEEDDVPPRPVANGPQDAADVTLEDLLQEALGGEGAPAARVRPKARPGDIETVAALGPSVSRAVTDGGIADVTEIVPGTRLIQLGAFDSEDLAVRQWSLMLGSHGDLLSNKQRYIQKADSNGRTFYRLRVVGFEGEGDQNAFCEALRARQVACIPVTVR